MPKMFEDSIRSNEERIMVYIVAELGTNWMGDMIKLQRMCQQAQEAGCNAVKFQALSQDLIDRHPELPWYRSASITTENVDFIHKIVQKYGLDMLVTPTYPECVDWLNDYVPAWKIRYADRMKMEIVGKCRNTSKPIYLSTDRPIKEYEGINEIKQIYCISKYPTAFGELNMDMIDLMPGYSNHCLNPLACLKAVRHDVEYLEFHLTDDKDDFALDNKVSLSYGEMREICYWIGQFEGGNALR